MSEGALELWETAEHSARFPVFAASRHEQHSGRVLHPAGTAPRSAIDADSPGAKTTQQNRIPRIVPAHRFRLF